MIQTGTIVMSISNNVITRNSGNFISEGFEVGNKITIFNSSDNTGVFTIKSITNTTINTNESMTDESSFSGVLLSGNDVLWNSNTIDNNISSDNINGLQHHVFINLGARGKKGITGEIFSTNRVGLKCETIGISTSKTVPTIPIPGIAAVTGEAQSVAIDLGMSTKSVNLSGVIVDQFITKKFKDSVDTVNNPSVYMTAHEIAQLMHSHADSSGLQQYQTMNELILLMPSRVNGRYSYHSALPESKVSNPTTFTDIADLPLVPFSYKVRAQDNQGSIYQFFPDVDGKKYTNYPAAIHMNSEIKGLSGFIRSFSTNFDSSSGFVTFTLDFEVAFTIG
tara:strand:- start:9288 stop:10295 length:1008 start_codon:yes stop_codon:yes gene_type:complete